jgi:site-specific recombinase XerD
VNLTSAIGLPPRRLGWHNFRHSLMSFLIASGADTKTVQ